MNVTIQQTEKLLRGQYVFKLWAFSMLVTQLKNDYAAASTQEILEQCVEKINTFLGKYHAVMAPDYAVIQTI